MKRKRKLWIWIVAAVLVALVVACVMYLSNGYCADMAAIEAFGAADIKTQTQKDGTIVFLPDKAKAGFIFYPGGKVEHTAYIPLMQKLAEQDILCVLIKMPFDLAVFDVGAADGIQAQYPEIKNWYIGGHSLGGAMAASYAADHPEEYEGLVLLGAYAAADLSTTDLKVLSVYGSEDLILNREKYNKHRSDLPDGFSEIVIAGGCHAYFGMYGPQTGDGTPTISNEEQILLTAEEIVALIVSAESEAV